MIVAGIISAIITAFMFVLALSRWAGLADRKMEEIYLMSVAGEAGGDNGD